MCLLCAGWTYVTVVTEVLMVPGQWCLCWSSSEVRIPHLALALYTRIYTWLQGQRGTKGDSDFFWAWNLAVFESFHIIPCSKDLKALFLDSGRLRKKQLTSERQRWVLPDMLDFSFCAWEKTNTQLFIHTMEELEKEMATHSSILAWKIPWTEEPGRLQSMGSQRVGHDWATKPFWKSTYWWSTV